MFRRDIGSLEILRGRGLVDGFATTATVVHKNCAAIENGYDDDKDDVADDVAWGGCEAETSGSSNDEGKGWVSEDEENQIYIYMYMFRKGVGSRGEKGEGVKDIQGAI